MESQEEDGRVEHEPAGTRQTTHARFQFHRLEEWKREHILKKQEEQTKLRRVLQAQVLEKKQRREAERLKLEQESRPQLQPTPSQETLPSYQDAALRPSEPTASSGDSPGFDKSLLPGVQRNTTRFSYEHKDELQRAEIRRKQKERELTRKLLEEQIAEKRRRKEAERRQQQKEQKSPVHIVNQGINQEVYQEHAASLHVGGSEALSSKISSVRQEEDCSGTAEEESPTDADETLATLRAQVKEQQKVLREQAATMMDLREKASEAIKLRDRALRKNERDESGKDPNPVKERRQWNTQKATTKPSKNNNKSAARRSIRGVGALQIRDVVLKRDSQGKLGLELGRSPHDRCIIVRTRKTFVHDERAKLRGGDLVLAIGNFKVRKLLRQATDVGIESLHDLSDKVPRYADVQRLFQKAGAVLKIAVCSVDMEVVEALLESESSSDEEVFAPMPKAKEITRSNSSSGDEHGTAYSERYLLESTSQTVHREDWNKLSIVLQNGES